MCLTLIRLHRDSAPTFFSSPIFLINIIRDSTASFLLASVDCFFSSFASLLLYLLSSPKLSLHLLYFSNMATPALEYDTHLTLNPDSQEYKDMEKRIVRKQDWRIMPLICLSYLLSSFSLLSPPSSSLSSLIFFHSSRLP